MVCTVFGSVSINCFSKSSFGHALQCRLRCVLYDEVRVRCRESWGFKGAVFGLQIEFRVSSLTSSNREQQLMCGPHQNETMARCRLISFLPAVLNDAASIPPISYVLTGAVCGVDVTWCHFQCWLPPDFGCAMPPSVLMQSELPAVRSKCAWLLDWLREHSQLADVMCPGSARQQAFPRPSGTGVSGLCSAAGSAVKAFSKHAVSCGGSIINIQSAGVTHELA